MKHANLMKMQGAPIDHLSFFSSLFDDSPFFALAGATFAGVDRSDCENLINMCIRTVIMARPTTENAIPFQEENNEVQRRNFQAPKTTKHVQEMTTCLKSSIHRFPNLITTPYMERKILL